MHEQLDNGQMVEPEIIPDFENEIIEEQAPPPRKKKGCGCGKNKEMMNEQPKQNNNLLWIGVAIGGLILMYFLFKGKKGGGETASISE
tara:strand:- start:160 stop:423 length:264 start_codon:yes stop_codon:yes gene_type:complete